MTVGHLYVFYGKKSNQALHPFFNCVVFFFFMLNCMGSLFILVNLMVLHFYLCSSGFYFVEGNEAIPIMIKLTLIGLTMCMIS